LAALGIRVVETSGGAVRWAEAVAGELLRRQAADGSWCNPAVDVREDEPVVATSLAAATLAACLGQLRGGR
jgi:hypothetical protein